MNYTPEELNLVVTPETNKPIHFMEFFMSILKLEIYPLSE